jgi:NAD(P)H-hydrate repair Nnr-like enzyme with NAD(P)H-hydrate dehydratase domain
VEPDAVPWDTVGRLSASWPSTLVLKGPFTSIGRGGRAWVHARPNPGLATAGSGDVLTGIIGGLLARGLGDEQAPRLGVWIHGRAGARAASGRPAGGTAASDLIDAIPEALAEATEETPRVGLPDL